LGQLLTQFGAGSGNEMWFASAAFVASALLCASCSDSTSRLEVIELIAIEDVQLVDPDTVVGKPIQVIGILRPGEILSVAECRPRKSDIDVVVVFDQKPSVAWQGKYKLSRRAADSSKDSPSVTTKSCWGLLAGTSEWRNN
jgi:hypothetical protein